MLVVGPGKFRLGRVLSLLLAAFNAACGVPDYKIQSPTDAGGAVGTGGTGTSGGVTATTSGGGSTSAVDGGGAVSTGGETQDPFDCKDSSECSTFAATNVCDTATNRCVECLSGVPAAGCGSGLYCGADKLCHLGCASDTDCGKRTDCDAAECASLTCDRESHECKGCTADADCRSGTICEALTGRCVSSCNKSSTCPTGWTCCNLGCVNLLTDPTNCASCDTRCDKPGAIAQCLNGTCNIDCKEGYLDCNLKSSDGCEVNRLSDSSNCGDCGVVCNSTRGIASCANGACSIACSQGYGDCDGDPKNGCETNITADALNCGNCLNSCAFNNASLGTCVNSTCSVGICSSGFADCNSKPSDGCEAALPRDPSNCGACGIFCSSTNGTGGCINGECSIVCSSGFGNCDNLASTGCEIDTTSSLLNCGACGKACAPANAVPTCAKSICSATCVAGFGNCDALLDNGCEANLKTDASNCDACGTKCSIANATAICNSGKCTIGSCNSGFADCDGDASNGCETNITADANHCGSCSKVCVSTNGTAICTDGACGINCNAGFGNCDSDVTNGCETNLANDVLHCGATCATSVTCPTTGGVNRVCNAGICGFDTCTAPTATCLGKGACATNLSNDVDNCGACGTKCSFANAEVTCTSSTCTLGPCAADYGNCDGNAANGCEASLQTDANNCNGCDNKCIPANATAVCTSGTCAIASCYAGYFDCDGAVSNGCEVNLKTDTSNCNACGTKCSTANGTASCADGVCKIACSSGYDNCDGSVTNGCEANLQKDSDNCGTCGHACAHGCTNGVCNTPCRAYSDCTASGMSIVVIATTDTNVVVLDIPEKTCYEYSLKTISGGNGWNFSGNKKLYVNGTQKSVPDANTNWYSAPAQVNGGYCFHSFDTVCTSCGTGFGFW